MYWEQEDNCELTRWNELSLVAEHLLELTTCCVSFHLPWFHFPHFENGREFEKEKTCRCQKEGKSDEISKRQRLQLVLSQEQLSTFIKIYLLNIMS